MKSYRVVFLCLGALMINDVSALEPAKSAGWRSAAAAADEPKLNVATVGELKISEPEVKVAAKSAPASWGGSIPKSDPAPDGQGLVVSYVKPKDKNFLELATVLQQSRGIDTIVDAVNETFEFPHIKVVFDMCEQENAFYDSENRQITLCYELVAGLAHSFSQDKELTEDQVGNQVIASLIFTFFHELGHAAVDVFDLPITGNEEDAVDRFAITFILQSGNAQSSDDDFDLADNAISFFNDVAEELEDLDFADEHPVTEQRWYTMACMMVGSDAEKYGYLIGEDGLPEERAAACPAEFMKISRGWRALMEPHARGS